MNATCLACHFGKQLETASALGDEKTAIAFARELMQLYLDSPDEVASPYFGPGVTALFQKYYGLSEDRYIQEKVDSNRFVMERFDAIQSRVQAQEDPVYAGLQFSIWATIWIFLLCRVRFPLKSWMKCWIWVLPWSWIGTAMPAFAANWKRARSCSI